MIPVRRLNHAVLFVSDVNRAVDFYTEAFGFAPPGGRTSSRSFAPGITNARTEGYNRVIKQLKRVGCGYRVESIDVVCDGLGDSRTADRGLCRPAWVGSAHRNHGRIVLQP